MRRGYPTTSCGVVLTGERWPGFEHLHGLDFELVSFVHITVHSPAQTDRPDLGGAPSQFPTVGKSMPRPCKLRPIPCKL